MKTLNERIDAMGIDLETWDPEKTRRVARDLLNKTQKKEDILKVALILGAKIERGIS
jgi:hypothetical protein